MIGGENTTKKNTSCILSGEVTHDFKLCSHKVIRNIQGCIIGKYFLETRYPTVYLPI